MTVNTHVACLAGEEVPCSIDTWESVCDALVQRHGGGTPTVRRLETPSVPLLPAQVSPPPAAPAPLRVGEVDAEGAARSETDYRAAAEAGFTLPPPLYTRGSRATGMALHREEWEALPRVAEAMGALRDTVRAERRRDVDVPASALRMDPTGKLVLPAAARVALEAAALSPLSQRLGMVSAGAYLRSVSPEVRAYNVNHAAVLAEPDARVKLRLRDSRDGRTVWAVTGDGYATADADRLASAIAEAIREPEARAAVAYDGRRVQVDALYFSDVPPDNGVAGEVFKVGIRLRSADDGTGSVRVDSVVWANLCLNFIILAEESRREVRLVHRGDANAIQQRVAEGLHRARARVGHFVERWGLACADDLCDRVGALAPDPLVAEAQALLAGAVAAVEGRARALVPAAFASLLQAGSLPIRASAPAVAALTRAWERDTSSARRDPDVLSRASLVNAATRWAHEAQPSPWVADGVERAAGKLLNPRARLFA